MSAYEYEVQGNYGYGWDMVTTEETRSEAHARLAEYRANERGAAFRVVRVRSEIRTNGRHWVIEGRFGDEWDTVNLYHSEAEAREDLAYYRQEMTYLAEQYRLTYDEEGLKA